MPHKEPRNRRTVARHVAYTDRSESHVVMSPLVTMKAQPTEGR